MSKRSDLKPDPKNARKHSDKNIEVIANSLQRDGFGRSILLAADGTVIAGNGVMEAAGMVGIEDVEIVESDGSKIIAIRRSDVAPDSDEFYRLALADNRSAELASWDVGVLTGITSTLDVSGIFSEEELSAIATAVPEEERTGKVDYSERVETPIYEPTSEAPDVSSLRDTTRRDALLAAIAAAAIPDDVRVFLEDAAHRHTVFDYRNIAEFYAHAEAPVQRLMEDSALVIIDIGRAIELGYAKLRASMMEIAQEAHEAESDE